MPYTFSRNVLKRINLILETSGPAAIEIVEIADPVTGAPITVLDNTLNPVVFPLALTQTPGNNLSWFSSELILQTPGEYIVEFNPDVGGNFTDTVIVTTEGGLPSPSLQKCLVEDFVSDLEGNPLENVAVSARVLTFPYLTGNVAISTDPVVVKTNEDGFFSVNVLRGATVDFIIARINYRRQVVIPDQAQVNLFSL